MPDPFGEERERSWRRIWRGDRSRGAPKRYARPAAAIGPLAAFLLPFPHGMDLSTKIAIAGAVFLGPPALVEIWWKRRSRRADERLAVLPQDL
jgi:hypothetical protein